MVSKVSLGSLLSVLTDYHANGAYKKLKENVELFDKPNYAVMIRTTNFEQECFDSNLKYISEHAYNFLGKSKVYTGDIIMNKIANAGSSYLMPELKRPVSLAMNLFLLRVDEKKANPTFVYLYLKLNEKYVKSFANGSVTKTITKEAVRNLEIELPDRAIQNYIVEVYMAYTNKLTLNHKTNQTLEQMAQVLFKSWFVDFDPVFDNALASGIAVNDFPEALQKKAEQRFQMQQQIANGELEAKPLPEDISQLFPSEFEQSNEPSTGINGWIPKGWQVKTIKSVSTALSKGTTPRKKDIDASTDSRATKFIKVKDIDGNGNIKMDGLETVPIDVHKGVLKRSMLKEFDVLFTIAGTIGRVAIVNHYLDNSNCNQAVAFIRATSHDYARFLLCYLKMEEVQTLVLSKVVQAVQANVSLGELGSIEFPSAPEDIIKEWNKLVTPIFSKIELCRENSGDLVKLRDTLLPKLISGELGLPNEDINSEVPAS